MELIESRTVALDSDLLLAAAATGKLPGSRRGSVRPDDVEFDPARQVVRFAFDDETLEIGGSALVTFVVEYLLTAQVPLPRTASKVVRVMNASVVLGMRRVQEAPRPSVLGPRRY